MFQHTLQTALLFLSHMHLHVIDNYIKKSANPLKIKRKIKEHCLEWPFNFCTIQFSLTTNSNQLKTTQPTQHKANNIQFLLFFGIFVSLKTIQ